MDGLLGVAGMIVRSYYMGMGHLYKTQPNIKIDQNSRSIDVENPLKIVSIDIDILDPEPNLDHSPITKHQ